MAGSTRILNRLSTKDMRYTLLLLVSLLSTVANAQWRFSAYGGAALSLLDAKKVSGLESRPTYTAGIQALRESKRFEFGIALEAQPLVATGVIQYVDINGNPLSEERVKMAAADPALVALAMGGYHRRYGKTGFAIGLMAGYASGSKSDFFGEHSGPAVGWYGRFERSIASHVDGMVGFQPRAYLLSNEVNAFTFPLLVGISLTL